jgi:mannose-6-phosphate isomerase-like protein (cupin superfamily)
MSNLKYSMSDGAKFKPLEIIDVGKLDEECRQEWFNQTLTQVNDCVVRLGIVKGEFHWHKHDKEDEFFYVVAGKLMIDLEGRSVQLAARMGFTVPRGVLHRTRAPERTVMLMVEGKTVNPTGD